MSITSLILGKTGTGKSASLRNFNPSEVALIQVVSKPLPFRSQGWRILPCDRWENIIAVMKKAKSKIIIVDDFQYILANEFMRRSDERGFDKFTEIGRHTWEIFSAALSLPNDVRVYFLSHTDESEDGQIKMKTIGRLLDDKITLEGMVTIVLRTHVQDGQYFFSTRNNGRDTVKSPIGLFDSDLIHNDLAAVDEAICNYYSINQEASNNE